MKNDLNVIVFGGNHHNTLGVIRSLGRRGVLSCVLLHDNSNSKSFFVLKSKYVKNYKVVKDCKDGLDYLLSIGDKENKQLIICCSDDASNIIDLNKEKLIGYYYVPGCEKQGDVNRLMNKKDMGEYASEVGLIVPHDVIISNGVIPTDTQYPCITKPIRSIDGKKDDIHVCNNKTELEEFVNKATCSHIQAQHYIEKEFEYQLIGCSLNGGEHIIIPGRTRIITQPICTNTGFLKYEKLDGTEPIKQCEKFLRGIKYSGLFSMEFIRGKDGTDYFMEINFRNDGNSICVTEAGVNLSYIWYSYHIHSKWEQEVQKNIKELYVMPEFTEIGLWYIGVISFSRFVQEMRMADVYMDYAKDDPSPTNGLYNGYMYFVKHLIKKPIRRTLVLFGYKS